MAADDERGRLLKIKSNLERRSKIFALTRAFFQANGFVEIETPIRVPAIAPESHIVPLQSESWFLATSPELHMKRLLAAGYDKIFQISHCFRKGERGKQHNTEFTLLEWYRTGVDYLQMVADTEQLMLSIAAGLGTGCAVSYQNQTIDISSPWPRLSVQDAFVVAVGWNPVELEQSRFDVDLVTKVIPSFASDRPTVLLDYPAAMASLARLKPSNPHVAERAEIFIGGLEIANAYTELIDVKEQKRRFESEIEQISMENQYKPIMPARFLEAMDYLPPCAGIALGMDRLTMLFCNTDSIDQVMTFTMDTA